MHTPVVMVPQTMTVQECAAKMKEMRIHQLPVVDEKGGLVGMVAATDFLAVAGSFG